MTDSISNYIDTELKTVLPNFQWRMIKNSKKKLIELYISFYVETSEEIQVQDMLGQNNEPGSVQFEDVICIYDPAYAHVKPQNYLAAIAFDSQTGLEKGYLDALLRQINLTTKQGMVELREFLSNDFAGEFKLTWNENNLNSLIKTMKDTNRYEEEKLNLNLDDDHSFFEKLQEDDSHDGVERV